MAKGPLGIDPRDPLDYVGLLVNAVPTVTAPRIPTVFDRKYPLQTIWRVAENPTSGSEGDQWMLVTFENTTGDARWIMVTGGGSGPLVSVDVDTATAPGTDPVLADGTGLIGIFGASVAAHSVPIETHSRAANQFNIEIQVGSDRTGAPSNRNDAGIVSFSDDHFVVDVNGYTDALAATSAAMSDFANAGIASFDNTQFTVDANGFVQLIGGGPAVDQFNVQFATAPGVNPVVPDANGEVIINGATVANATNANSPVATHTRNVNEYNIEVQLSAAVTATPADAFDAGICSFDDAAFTVDANGFVQLIGGGAPTVAINVDASTPPGTNPVVPDAMGEITITGAQVAAGTVGANVIRTDSLAANTITVEVQRSTAVSATDSTNNGVAHFDSADFTVDANGFVQMVGSGPPNPTDRLFEFDDFLGTKDPTDNGGNSKIGWLQGNSSVLLWNSNAITTESGHPGIVIVRTSSSPTFTTLEAGNSGTTRGGLILGGGVLIITWIIRITTLGTASHRYTLRVGLSDAAATAAPANGLYFEYADNVNSGNWQGIARAASVSSTANSTDAASTNWVNLQIEVNAAANSVIYRIDGTEIDNSPLTTNIPTAINMQPFVQMNRTVGTADRDIYCDLVIIDYQLTTGR